MSTATDILEDLFDSFRPDWRERVRSDFARHPNDPARDPAVSDAIKEAVQEIEDNPETMRELAIKAMERNDAGNEILQALYLGQSPSQTLIKQWHEDLSYYVQELAEERVRDEAEEI